ncbi:MAG: hypothetical protein ACQEVA_06615 [Myxococcota bacterium]
MRRIFTDTIYCLLVALVFCLPETAAAQTRSIQEVTQVEPGPLSLEQEADAVLTALAELPALAKYVETCNQAAAAHADKLQKAVDLVEKHRKDVPKLSDLPDLPGREPGSRGVLPGAAEFAGLQDLALRGLYQFIAERTEEELLRFAIGRLRATLCEGDGESALRRAFPATCSIMDGVGNSDTGLATLQRSLHHDLQRLPVPLLAVLADGEAFEGRDGLMCGLGTAIGLERAMSAAAPVDDATAVVLDAAFQTDACQSGLGLTPEAAEMSGQLVRLVAATVGDDTGRYRRKATLEESIERLRDTLADGANDLCPAPKIHEQAQRLRLFLRREKQTVQSDETASGSAVGDTSGEAAKTGAQSAPRSRGLPPAARLAHALDAFESERANDLATLAKRVVEQAKPVIAFARVAYDPASDIYRYSKGAVEAPDEAARAAAIRDLTSAWLRMLDVVLDHAAAGSPESEIASQRLVDVVQAGTAFRMGDFDKGMSLLVASGWMTRARGEAGKFVAVSHLLSGIATAESPEEVRALVAGSAELQGSWGRRRRERILGVSAMFGLGGGLEFVPDGERALYAGAQIPVGITGSVPLGSKWTVGALVQVIDFGSAASLQLSGAQLDSASLSVPQLFAPGLNLFLGLGNSPFLLELHGSYSLDLRRGPDGEPLDVWRAGIGLGVDIPILLY